MTTHHPPLTTFLDPHLAALHLAALAADAGLPAERAGWSVLNRAVAEFEGFPRADLYAVRLGGNWRPVTATQAHDYLRRDHLVCACGLS